MYLVFGGLVLCRPSLIRLWCPRGGTWKEYVFACVCEQVFSYVCEHVFGIWWLEVLCRPSLIRLGAPVGEHERQTEPSMVHTTVRIQHHQRELGGVGGL